MLFVCLVEKLPIPGSFLAVIDCEWSRAFTRSNDYVESSVSTLLDIENEEEYGYSFLRRSLPSAILFDPVGLSQSRWICT